jgi:hypothetical protein
MRLSDIKPHPGNPRKITDEQLTTLSKMLAAYGDLSGLVYNVQTRRLVGGHQRLKCLPLQSEITYEIRYPTPTKTGTVSEGYAEVNGERFKYREVMWDEDKERAANIAANKAGGDWETKVLADWLLDLDAKGWDIEDATGFTDQELEILCAPFQKEEEKEPKEKTPNQCPKCGHLF